MKKTALKSLAAALATAATLGVSGQASADVYGLGRLVVTDFTTEISGLTGGTGPGLWNFTTSANASLNGGSSGGFIQDCFGNGVGPGTCGGPGPGIVLSGPVQNAPGGDVNRADNDVNTLFAQTGQYSNAESVIADAQLVGDPATSAAVVAESNLQGGFIASASANVASTTSLNFEFTLDDPGGGIALAFNADWNAIADITGLSQGVALGVISSSVTITASNGTEIEWVPEGGANAGIVECSGPGAVSCASVEAGNLNANSTTATNGVTLDDSGNGFFSLTITGLESGTYAVSYAASAQTLVSQEVPVPATLLLLGAGLLAGAGLSRRKAA